MSERMIFDPIYKQAVENRQEDEYRKLFDIQKVSKEEEKAFQEKQDEIDEVLNPFTFAITKQIKESCEALTKALKERMDNGLSEEEPEEEIQWWKKEENGIRLTESTLSIKDDKFYEKIAHILDEGDEIALRHSRYGTMIFTKDELRKLMPYLQRFIDNKGFIDE